MRRLLVCACMLGLLTGCDTYPDISDDTSGAPSPSSTSNDSLFDAESISESTLLNGTLDADDTQDYFKFVISPSRSNGPLIVTLTGVAGDADIELFDFNLNLISWSRTEQTSNETITLWHDAAYNDDSYDVGRYFVRVYSTNAEFVDYSLSYNFDMGNAE